MIFLPRPDYRQLLLAGLICAVLAHGQGHDAMIAAAQDRLAVSVTCSRSEQVSATSLAGLCDDFQQALASNHTRSQFSLVNPVPEPAAPYVALHAITVTNAGIEASLKWQKPGQNAVSGPATGMSVTDHVLTPAMRLQFLKHLVSTAALPF